MRHLFATWLVAVGLGAIGAPGSSLQSQIFKSTTDLVSVTATVLDKKGVPVLGLEKQDFTLFEDGKPQEVTFFTAEEQPISVAIVVDTSGSMVDTIDDVRDAVQHFVDGLRAQDEVSLLRFSADVEVLIEFGDSRDRVRRTIDRRRTTKCRRPPVSQRMLWIACMRRGPIRGGLRSRRWHTNAIWRSSTRSGD